MGTRGMDGGIPRDSLQQRAWATMRIAPTWDVGELELIAGRGSPHTQSDLRRYARALTASGHVAALPGCRTGGKGRFRRYRLVRNTGPCAPVHRRLANTVYDPNDGREYDIGGGAPCKPASR